MSCWPLKGSISKKHIGPAVPPQGQAVLPVCLLPGPVPASCMMSSSVFAMAMLPFHPHSHLPGTEPRCDPMPVLEYWKFCCFVLMYLAKHTRTMVEPGWSPCPSQASLTALTSAQLVRELDGLGKMCPFHPLFCFLQSLNSLSNWAAPLYWANILTWVKQHYAPTLNL